MFKAFLEQAGLEEHQHQVEGVEWCLQKEKEGVFISTPTTEKTIHGGIIADEMGLGKTIQLVGTMFSNEKPHTLIVLPKALLDQWIHVIKKMLKQKPLIYHGIWKKDITIDQIKSYPVVITTYGMISAKAQGQKLRQGQADTALSLLHQVNWDRIIFDEAHHMRNNKTNIFNGAVKLQAQIKWLVTGTPIQNKRSDLYSLCELLGLPSKYFTSPANLPIFRENFILHRTKESTGLNLPKLTVQTIHVPWTNAYECNLSEDIHKIFKFSHISKKEVNTPACLLGEYTLVALLRARQACILPHLLSSNYEKYIKQQQQIINLDNHEEIVEAINSSSKMDIVIKTIVDRKDNGKPKLIFCHFRGEIDYIKESLIENGLTVESFDGRTNEKQRHTILTNTKIEALILQIQTGCEGLNLQQFCEVYFISPHWNPAIEDQAIARCHRFGQKEDVDVYRFNMTSNSSSTSSSTSTSTSTIDEYSFSVQEKKRVLMDEIYAIDQE